jgi:ABC-type antimicrobial peptide transport system permease subunit
MITQSVKQLYAAKNVQLATVAADLLTEQEAKKQKSSDSGRGIGLLIFIFLLIPAVNIATLNKANTQNRMEEIAIRRACGAGRLSSFCLILFENLLLTLLGALIGMLLAEPAMSLLLNSLFDKVNMLNMLMPKINILIITGVIIPLMI